MLPANREKQEERGLSMRTRNPFDLFRQEMGSLFDRFFPAAWMPFETGFGEMRVWDFDMQEGEKETVVRAELPGFDAADIDVQVNNNVLTIKAEHKCEMGEGDARELCSNSFRRTVTLPQDVKADEVDASYRNGVLELHLPHTEQPQAKRIHVRSEAGDAGGATGAAHQTSGETQAKKGAHKAPATVKGTAG